MGPLLPKVIDT